MKKTLKEKTLKEKIEVIRRMKKTEVIAVLLLNNSKIIIDSDATYKELQNLLIDLLIFNSAIRNKYNVTINDKL